ncbi:hypothetical protein [Alloprevotella tannerae]|uniref:hypothetical protein n=1 Tax=Alloprevotella tannerae TaxID=76122 RepID=UPI0028F082AB|nr:hypothetical protein [Alloprevotella tannerae]
MTKRKQTERAGYKEACELLRRAYKESDYNFSDRMTDNEAMTYVCEALFHEVFLCVIPLSQSSLIGGETRAIRETLRRVFFVLANRKVDFAESDFYELPQVHFENKSMSTICYELSRVLPFNDTPTMRDKLLKIFVRQLFELAFFVGIDVLSED